MATAAGTPASSRDAAWLYGRGPDLLLGAGVGYLVSVPVLLALAIRGDGTPGWPFLVSGAIAVFLSVPHYGATLLRVYERDADRRRYSFFTVHLSVFLAAALVVGAHSPLVGSVLIT